MSHPDEGILKVAWHLVFRDMTLHMASRDNGSSLGPFTIAVKQLTLWSPVPESGGDVHPKSTGDYIYMLRMGLEGSGMSLCLS